MSRFTVGCGLNYSNNIIARGSRSLGDPTVAHYSDNRENQALGITLNGFYHLGRNANVGLIFRPTFFNLKPNETLNYDHRGYGMTKNTVAAATLNV